MSSARVLTSPACLSRMMVIAASFAKESLPYPNRSPSVAQTSISPFPADKEALPWSFVVLDATV